MRIQFTVVLAAVILPAALPAQQTVTGQAAFADWSQQQPGVRRKITLADPIKVVGEYEIPVKLHREISANVKVTVKKEE